MSKIEVICVIFLVCTSITDSLAKPSGHDASWGYPKAEDNGVMPVEHWGDECDLGRRQSPIDLTSKAAVKGVFPKFEFDNYDIPIRDASVINTGHSVQINAHPEQEITMMEGGLPGKFQFDQLHFHWGSEHTIEGVREAVELHLVHHDQKYKSLGEAAKHKRGIAVLGILFHVAPHKNIHIEEILIASEGVSEHVGRNQSLKRELQLEDLLPHNRSSYFRYEGSLTTPGCAESVIWTVFTHSLPVSLDQVERFKTLKSDKGEELIYNFRSVKPLGARALVYVSRDKDEYQYKGDAHVPQHSLLSVILMPFLIKMIL